MKKYFYILAALSIMPNFALAQSFDNEVDSELDQIATQQQIAQPTQAAVLPAAQAAAPAGGVGTGAQQPIYILNQGSPVAQSSAQQVSPQTQTQTAAQAAVQKQPTTTIEATPLTESRAEAIRKARQDAEVQTEQKIVEKLETSRMDDEKKRANVLFGDKFQQMEQQPQAAPVVAAPVQQVQQVQQVQPAPIVPVQQVQEQPKQDTRDMVREEIRAAMKSEDEAKPDEVQSRYFGAMAGVGAYPDVNNVRGNYSLGAQFGTIYDESMIVEGSFIFSNYSVDQIVNNGYSLYGGTVDMNQYSGALAVKYQFLNGLIRPVLGGVAQYSYRTFAWSSNNTSYSSSDSASSNALDVGIVSGLDIAFNQRFTLGFDFRYLWNVASSVSYGNNSTWMPGYQVGTPIEKLQYYTMSLVGRVSF